MKTKKTEKKTVKTRTIEQALPAMAVGLLEADFLVALMTVEVPLNVEQELMPELTPNILTGVTL